MFSHSMFTYVPGNPHHLVLFAGYAIMVDGRGNMYEVGSVRDSIGTRGAVFTGVLTKQRGWTFVIDDMRLYDGEPLLNTYRLRRVCAFIVSMNFHFDAFDVCIVSRKVTSNHKVRSHVVFRSDEVVHWAPWPQKPRAILLMNLADPPVQSSLDKAYVRVGNQTIAMPLEEWNELVQDFLRGNRPSSETLVECTWSVPNCVWTIIKECITTKTPDSKARVDEIKRCTHYNVTLSLD